MKDDSPSKVKVVRVNQPIRLIPTSYSKKRKLKDIIKCLEKCPDQKCNTPQASKGLVMEFYDENDSTELPGALSEWYEHGKHTKVIICADDGEVLVTRNRYYEWIPEIDSSGLSLLDKSW